MRSMSLEWFGGFSCGDSSFAVIARKSSNSKIGFRIVTRLRWSQCGIPHTAGFWDADGSFVLRVAKEKSHRLGFSMSPQIKGTSYDDLIIANIEKIFKEEKITYSVSTDSSTREEFTITVTHLPSVKLVCELLFPYLIGKKKIQCALFLQEIIPRLERAEHLTKEGFIELLELRETISFTKKGNRKRYSAQYFKELWDLTAERGLVV